VDRFLLALTPAGQARDGFRVVQHPPTERWVALPGPPGPHAASILVHATGAAGAGQSTAGFVVDEWSEVVPTAATTAGVAFHFDEPAARAPQALLLAVPPELDRPWTLDVLADIVAETADLARIRTVGPAEAPWLGRYVPALYLPDNPAGDTLRVDAGALLTGEHDP
jgi:hypothetical protein